MTGLLISSARRRRNESAYQKYSTANARPDAVGTDSSTAGVPFLSSNNFIDTRGFLMGLSNDNRVTICSTRNPSSSPPNEPRATAAVRQNSSYRKRNVCIQSVTGTDEPGALGGTCGIDGTGMILLPL